MCQGGHHPVIAKSWRANWARVVPMFGYLVEVRRTVYTTNTIESLNMTLRKVLKNRPLFSSDEAVFELLYLALWNISRRWTMLIKNWGAAMNQFAIIFEGRVPLRNPLRAVTNFIVELPTLLFSYQLYCWSSCWKPIK